MTGIYLSAHEKTSCIIRERSRIIRLMNTREERALEIADKYRIVNDGQKWFVPSQSSKQKYTVRIVGERADCNCPDFELRRSVCKHVLAVQLVIQRQQNPDGTTTETKTITVTERKTYPQKWTEYNNAQTNEKYYFQALLHGLCSEIPTPPQKGKGQRRLPLADAIFAATFKVQVANPNNEIWAPNPDLSKVDEIGFADLMPGSGHGTGGYIQLGNIEVYANTVPLATATSSSR